jgi:E3 ubiquitin-protein ligase RNF38/44
MNTDIEIDEDENFDYEIYSTLEDVKILYSENDFDKLERIRFKNNLKKILNKCVFCLEYFKLRNILIILKCNHFFHRDCFKKWCLNYSKKCPICRS